MKWIKRVLKKLKQGIKVAFTPPPGFEEYHRAIRERDQTFNFMENEYFRRVILPRCQPNLFNQTSINGTMSNMTSVSEPFRINPASGLPMIGVYDAAGNAFGFNTNYHSHNNSISQHHSSYNNNSMFDYWR